MARTLSLTFRTSHDAENDGFIVDILLLTIDHPSLVDGPIRLSSDPTHLLTSVAFDPHKIDRQSRIRHGGRVLHQNYYVSTQMALGLQGYSSGKKVFQATFKKIDPGADQSGPGVGNDSDFGRSGYLGETINGIGLYQSGVYFNGSNIGTVEPFGPGDIITVAADLTAKKIWYKVNEGDWNNNPSANPATSTGEYSFAGMDGPFKPAVNLWEGDASAEAYLNLNPQITLPSGFSVWGETAMSDILYGTISRGDDYLFLPFRWVPPTDGDEAPPALRLSIENFSPEIIALLRSVTSPATVSGEVVNSYDPDVVEMPFPEFDIVNMNYDDGTVEITCAIDSLVNIPVPSGSFTPGAFGGLF